jgi:CRP-like cAMP-binding protein
MPDFARASALEILNQGRWFSRQPAALKTALVERGRIASFERGQWIHSEGDASGGLWGVLSGAVRLEVTVGLERDVLVNIVGPGAMAGITLAAGGGPRIATARAGEQSRVLLVPDPVLQAIGAEHPSLWRAVSELLYSQLERTAHLAAEALRLPPRARVAARLLALAREDRAGGVFAAVSQTDLAEMTGLSRKSVNGHLRRLQGEGTVRPGYRGVHLLDRGRLETLVARS